MMLYIQERLQVKAYHQDIQLSINYFKPYKYKYLIFTRYLYLYSIFKKI